MAESQFIQSQLDEQMNQRDPFQRAQAMFQQSQAPDMNQPQPDAAAPTSNINDLLQQPKAYQNGGQSNGFTSMLKQFGVPSDGLQYNDLGKMQLQARLSQRFGPGYEQLPDAMQIMKSFDQYRSQISQGEQDVGKQSAAQRTLAFIMGGQS